MAIYRKVPSHSFLRRWLMQWVQLNGQPRLPSVLISYLLMILYFFISKNDQSIKGKSSKPVYLWIHDGEYELKDANHLWGKVTGEVQDIVREEQVTMIVGTPKWPAMAALCASSPDSTPLYQ